MGAGGHHEFGIRLTPVNRGGWLDGEPRSLGLCALAPVVAYQFILVRAKESAALISYPRLTEEQEMPFSRLADTSEFPTEVLTLLATELRLPRSYAAKRCSQPLCSGKHREPTGISTIEHPSDLDSHQQLNACSNQCGFCQNGRGADIPEKCFAVGR